MLVHCAATYFCLFPQLLPYGNSEGIRYLIVLSGGEPSQCGDGQGLVVDGVSPIRDASFG